MHKKTATVMVAVFIHTRVNSNHWAIHPFKCLKETCKDETIVTSYFVVLLFLLKINDTELTQNRSPVALGPSEKT